MSPISKGMTAIVLGVFAVFSNAWLNMFHIRLGVTMTLGVSFLCSVLAIYLGIKARKGGSKIVGLIGLVLGIIGVIVLGTAIISVVGANSN